MKLVAKRSWTTQASPRDQRSPISTSTGLNSSSTTVSIGKRVQAVFTSR